MDGNLHFNTEYVVDIITDSIEQRAKDVHKETMLVFPYQNYIHAY